MMKTLTHSLRLAALLILLSLGAASCHFRPLEDPTNVHYIRVYLDSSIMNINCGFYEKDGPRKRPDFELPEVMVVKIADPQSGRVVAERYLQNRDKDERGVYYDGYIICPKGNYCLMSYNFGTESTIIRNPDNFGKAEAYTNAMSASMMTKIPSYVARMQKTSTKAAEVTPVIFQPDPLFTAIDHNLHIEGSPLALQHVDTLYAANGGYFTATPFVDAYYLQLRIRNARYASSVVGLLTGQSGAKTLSNSALHYDKSSTLYLEMETAAPDEENVAVLYTTFTTFGRLENSINELSLNFELITTTGETFIYTVENIADRFLSEDGRLRHWLLLDDIIDVPEPTGGDGNTGGFSPIVGGWQDEQTEIEI